MVRWILGMCLVFILASLAALAGTNEATGRVWDVAKSRAAVPGAPKYSDVTMRSLVPHPSNPRDPWDTLAMARAFHLTRLEWVFELKPEFVAKAKALGLTVGGTLSSAEPDANKSLKVGRVTGQDGLPKTHKWFPAGRWVGCANAPEYRAAWLYQARRAIDAGADLMQQDDPVMALSCTSLCYCRHCTAAFARYQAAHGKDARYDDFQKESILAFHREMHRQLDAYAGRHVPFSENTHAGFEKTQDWTTPAFDFSNAEIDPNRVQPVTIHKLAAHSRARGIPLVFQYRDRSVEHNRRALAMFYANGMQMLLPWDVFFPNNAPRYFGKPEDYADLSGFIRAMGKYLDGYEEAAAAGRGMDETRYGAAKPVQVEGGSGEAFAFVRALPGQPEAPVVIHLVDWAGEAKPFTIRIRNKNFVRGERSKAGKESLDVKLWVPAAYDAEAHRKAQERGDFQELAVEAKLNFKSAGEFTEVWVPVLKPWGILVVSGQ